MTDRTDETPAVTREMVNLYDEYTHVTLDRRGFMDALTKMAGGTAAAAALVPVLAANSAAAAQVAADDPRLATMIVDYEGSAGRAMGGYVAMPADATGPLPGVVVVHENRGLNDHIRDVARRAALEGFVALAPDFLTPAGGTPGDEDEARDMIRALDPGAAHDDGAASAAFLRAHEATTGAIAAVGFCWGGAMVNQIAVRDPELRAAAPFYGRQPDAADVPEIEAALMLHYAGLDDRINAGIDAYVAALDAAGTEYRLFTYEGANHAFHNDTSEARYDEAAATLAWSRTMDFFKDKTA